MSETTRLVFVDSKNRDQAQFPNGNAYVLHLTTPVKNVSRIDLVSARVPNTMYNLTNGSNAWTLNGSNVSMHPGFYSAQGLVDALTSDTVTVDYLPEAGKFCFSGPSLFQVKIESPELARMIGLVRGTTYTSSLATTLDPVYIGQQILRSVTLIDLSLNEYVFLDIEELRTPWNLDAKSVDSAKGTFSGSNATRMFAPIVMDVSSGCIKNFHENKDYIVTAAYPEPIGVLQRLTVHWYDKHGAPLDFRGWDTNAFVLRLHVTEDEDRRLQPPPPLQDVEIKRLVEAMNYQIPKPTAPEPRKKIQWWLIVFALLGAIFAYRTFGRPKPTLP